MKKIIGIIFVVIICMFIGLSVDWAKENDLTLIYSDSEREEENDV